MTGKKYVLTMNEEQAKITVAALDFYMRMRIGQWRELVDLCLQYDYQNALEFSAYQSKRDEAEKRLLQIRQFVMPDCPRGGSFGVYNFTETERAFNVLKAVRSAMAWHKKPEGDITVDFDRPTAINVAEDMPKCEVRE